MALKEEFRQIGYDIIGAAFTVRNETGRGLREIFYKKAFVWELQQLGYKVDLEVPVPALYKGLEISDAFLADIVVDDRVMIEAKAVNRMGETEARQMLTYLRLSRFKLGYLINFGARDFGTGKLSDPMPYTKGIYRFIDDP